ncbi:hypothetical protein [Arenimonas oryziterrae]|uniref:Uncharacterized protein n=1 Tax=Arenimonas oryziterrae DSM 21050 = YC6267 TaxID=1121015 RepID=A0A091AUV2_9GAMM|nr:hypothetical protein [Arenimonas oryziterrae]KFN43027.1 hypothetical protein N789_10725 [Arenimonas oryziterrae DSM 21050 = YC6267]
MNNEDQVVAVLNQILEVQRQTLANQQQAIAQQQVAIQRQATHLRLYKAVLIVSAPVIAYFVYTFVMLLPSSH